MHETTAYSLLLLQPLRANVTVRVHGYLCPVNYYNDTLIILLLSCFQNLSMPLLTTHHVGISLNHC